MEDIIIFGYDEQGIVDNPNPIPRGINTNALTKHTSSFGLSGAGKTTGNFNLLYQLFEKRVPFMVVETAKKEYRALKKSRKHKNKCFCELAEILEFIL